MNDLLAQVFHADDFRKEGHELVDLLADYLAEAQSGASMKICPWISPQESYAHWENYQFTSAKDFFKEVLQASNHLHHPRYLGHQVSPSIPVSALSGLLTSILKNGSGVFEMAPVGTIMEKYVAKELAKYIGYDDNADGIITSGGTLANLTALLTARQAKGKGDIWNDGLKGNENLAIMVSGEAHYCIDRAARIMGLGADGIIKVPVGENFRVDPEMLELTYQEATNAGQRVFAIVGNACSTATGSYDNLERIGHFAKEKNLWFHADAAHGGAALFSRKYRSLLKGIPLADSVVIDSHKMMLTAGLATALVYKNGMDSYRTFQVKAQYLFEESQDKDWYNMAKRTFECTKFMTVLSTYIVLKKYGGTVIEAYIDQTYDLAKSFYDLLAKDDSFLVVHQPESNIICFRYTEKGKTEEELNILNKQLRDTIIQEGHFYLVQTTIHGIFYLRVCIMNPFTEMVHLKELLAALKNQALQCQPSLD